MNTSPALRSRPHSRASQSRSHSRDARADGDDSNEGFLIDDRGAATAMSASPYIVVPSIVAARSPSASTTSSQSRSRPSKQSPQTLASTFPPLPDYPLEQTIGDRVLLFITQSISLVLSSLILLTLVTLSWIDFAHFQWNQMMTAQDQRYDPVDQYSELAGILIQRGNESALSNADEKAVKDMSYYANRCGLECDTHDVLTQDRYILTMHHIRDPKRKPEDRPGHPILLLHGLFQSSGAFIGNEHQSLGFQLVRSGHDVWLGNNRCGFGSRHASLSPSNPRFWNWTIKDLAMYDVPAMVDFVLARTKSEKLAFVGHSQGNAQCFMALALMPELGKKLSSFTAIAPAVFSGSLLKSFPFNYLTFASPRTFMILFGKLAFCPQMYISQPYMPATLHATMAYRMFAWLFGWHDHTWINRRKAKYFQFTPEPVSARSLEWWLSTFSRNGGLFPAEMDTTPNNSHANGLGIQLNGTASYSTFPSVQKRWFDQSTFPPLALLFAGGDNLVAGQDVLEPYLREVEGFEQKQGPGSIVHSETIDAYLHMDVVWAADVDLRVGNVIERVVQLTT